MVKNYREEKCVRRKEKEETFKRPVFTSQPSRTSSNRRLQRNHNSNNNQHQHQPQKPHQLHILPPHPPLQVPAPNPELPRTPAQPIRLINQQIHPLPPLQQPLNIPRHNPPHIINLPLRRRNSIILSARRSTVIDHQIPQIRIEAPRAVVGHVGEVGRLDRESIEEALADLEEEAKGDAAPEAGLGDYEEGETASVGVVRVVGGCFGDVVDVVGAVGVGELLGGGVLNFGEDEGGEGGGLGGG